MCILGLDLRLAKIWMIEYLTAQKEIDVCNLALMFRLINQSHSTCYSHFIPICKSKKNLMYLTTIVTPVMKLTLNLNGIYLGLKIRVPDQTFWKLVLELELIHPSQMKF